MVSGTWKLLKHTAITDANGATEIDSGTFDKHTMLRVIVYIIRHDTNGMGIGVQFNDDGGSGNKYTYRNRANGSVAAGLTSKPEIFIDTLGSAGVGSVGYGLMDISNEDGKEKMIFQNWLLQRNGTGNNSPSSNYSAGKWQTTLGQISSIQITNGDGYTGKFAQNSFITIYGAETSPIIDEKDDITNVPANTRYEETDTRKIFRRTAGTQSYNSTTTNVTLSNSNLTATSTSTAWGNRAYSTVSYNPTNIPSGETREFKFTMGDITKNGFMGFDSTPTTISGHGNDNNASGVDYGMYLVGNGSSNNYLEVSEQGTNKYQSSSNFITSNTIFKITVDSSGVVKYYADDTDGTTLRYTSLTAMSGDFYVLFYPYDSGFTTTITSWSNNPEWKERNTA